MGPPAWSLCPGGVRRHGLGFESEQRSPCRGETSLRASVTAERASCPAVGSPKQLGQEGRGGSVGAGSGPGPPREEPGPSRNHGSSAWPGGAAVAAWASWGGGLEGNRDLQHLEPPRRGTERVETEQPSAGAPTASRARLGTRAFSRDTGH